MHKGAVDINAAGPRPLRVILVDEHPVILAGLSALFSGEPEVEVSGSFETRDDALAALGVAGADVIITGLEIGRDAGFDFVRLVDGVPVIILTNCDDPQVAHRALQFGARGYILTSERTENIVMAVKLVARGEVYLCGSMVTKMLSQVAKGSAVSEDAVTSALTKRELQVFELIGHGLSSRQVAEKLRLSPKTVDTYRHNIRTKLLLRDNAEILPKAIDWVHNPSDNNIL